MYTDAGVIDLSSDEDDGPYNDGRCRLDKETFIKASHRKPPVDKDFKQTVLHNDNGNPVKEEAMLRESCMFEDDGADFFLPRSIDMPGIVLNETHFIKDETRNLDERAERIVFESPGTTVHDNDVSRGASSPASVHQNQISRRFWKAGDYDANIVRSQMRPNGLDHVRVHPKFLHSNATSHKWALGAIAELIDNAIDEVQNGATYVSVDTIVNPRDGGPMLLIQDNGGGMDPNCMRQCMSLGYSRKTANTTIGQYGNGFKTSTMRLGADVIVFSRCSRNGYITESIGLLSYTFLRTTGKEDTVVPMVDFDVASNGGVNTMLIQSTKEDWLHNLSIILQWSPYKTEVELLKQFQDVQPHGTRVIVYNLWLNDDGELELDFEADKQDIQLRGAPRLSKSDTFRKQLSQQHIANRLRYSLRAYSSVLYLQMPKGFQIILRGHIVEHLSIASDLKFPERILYKPQIGSNREFGCREVSVITTIGFAKETPMIDVHGFNVYHKNRLIMPFWRVFHENSSRGKGVVGVLEANFMEPAHDKQDFERTPILQRLEARLRLMTIEYWNLHCELIGYQPPRQSSKAGIQSNNTCTTASRFSVLRTCDNQHRPHPQTIIATGIPAALLVSSGMNGAATNKLHPKFPSVHLDFSGDGKLDDMLQGRVYNFTADVNCATNIGMSTSAPFTPPHPGCDLGTLGKQVDDASNEKHSNFKVESFFGNTDDSIYTQGGINGRDIGHSEENGIDVGKPVDQEVVLAKRLATEANLQGPDATSKRQVFPDIRVTPIQAFGFSEFQNKGDMVVESLAEEHDVQTAYSTAEIIEEIKQLRLRCKQYEWEKRQLQLKVFELQQELLKSNLNHQVCQEHNTLDPKEELQQLK